MYKSYPSGMTPEISCASAVVESPSPRNSCEGSKKQGSVFVKHSFSTKVFVPSKRDTSGIFVGLVLDLSTQRRVSVQASISSPSAYGSGRHSSLMTYCFYVLLGMKRSVVLGMAAHVESCTLLAETKPLVLASSLKYLQSSCGFPAALLKKWTSTWRKDSIPWVMNVWRYF